MKKVNVFKLFILVICISLCIYFIYLLCKNLILKEKYNINLQSDNGIENFNDNGIDIVITWVENTPKLQKEREEWLNKGGYSRPSDARYTDNEEMKYLLRSIEKHFPNYRYIYIIMKDEQFPKYLKPELKNNKTRLKIIKHSDIIPKEYLPTFNSRAIEMYLHHIKGLSEYYIYANDDFIFTKDTDRSYYIDPNNKPYVLLTNDSVHPDTNKNLNLGGNGFKCGLSFNSQILDKMTRKEKRYEVPHCPMMYKKSYDFEIEKHFKKYFPDHDKKNNYFDKTGAAKFRRCDDLYMVSLIKPYFYKNLYNCEEKDSDATIINSYNNKERKINNRFICVEDISHNNFEQFKKFMDNLFPDKTIYEI